MRILALVLFIAACHTAKVNPPIIYSSEEACRLDRKRLVDSAKKLAPTIDKFITLRENAYNEKEWQQDEDSIVATMNRVYQIIDTAHNPQLRGRFPKYISPKNPFKK